MTSFNSFNSLPLSFSALMLIISKKIGRKWFIDKNWGSFSFPASSHFTSSSPYRQSFTSARTMASASFSEDVSGLFSDSVVWPKLFRSASYHALFTFGVYSVWTLCVGGSSFGPGFYGRALFLSALQFVSVLAVAFRTCTSNTTLERVAEVALFAVFSLSGGLCVWAICSVATGIAWLPGPLFGLLLISRPPEPIIVPRVAKSQMSDLKDRLLSNLCAGGAIVIILWCLRLATSLRIDGIKWSGVETGIGLCTYLWFTGTDILDLIIGEGHHFLLENTGQDSLPRALTANNAVKQALAFADLCWLSEERGIRTSRRQQLFESQGSNTQVVWNKIATACLKEFEALILRLRICVAKEHNEVFHGMSAGKLPAHRKEVENALSHVQSHFTRLSVSARSMAGMASASYSEDRTGIVRTGNPGLEKVVTTLVEALVLLDNLIREKESWTTLSDSRQLFIPLDQFIPWACYRDAVDDAASLYFITRGAIASLCNSFGFEFISQALTSSKARPHHVTARALQNGLLGCIEVSSR